MCYIEIMGKKQRQEHRRRRNINRKKNVPKSELWFRDLYKVYHHWADEVNQVFAGYIPDIINKFYMYIIEIDELERVKQKDAKKDKRYKALGYKVIRIKAYDIESFEAGMKVVCAIRGPHYKPARILTLEEVEKLTNRVQTTDQDRE